MGPSGIGDSGFCGDWLSVTTFPGLGRPLIILSTEDKKTKVSWEILIVWVLYTWVLVYALRYVPVAPICGYFLFVIGNTCNNSLVEHLVTCVNNFLFSFFRIKSEHVSICSWCLVGRWWIMVHLLLLFQHLSTEPPNHLPTFWLACSILLFPYNQKHPSEIRICTAFPHAGALHWLLLTLGWDLSFWPWFPRAWVIQPLASPWASFSTALYYPLCPSLSKRLSVPWTNCLLIGTSSVVFFPHLLAMADHFAGPISSFLLLSMYLQWTSCGQSSQLWSWPDDSLWPIACGSAGCFSGRCEQEKSISDQGPHLVEVRISGCVREHSFYNRVKRDEVHFFSIKVIFQKLLFFSCFSYFVLKPLMCISQLSEKVYIQSWPEISTDQESLSVQVPIEGHLHYH